MSTDTVHLIGIGRIPAVPLSQVQPGDRITWNYGQTYTVVSNRQVTRTLWELTERVGDGREWTRRKQGTKLVARTLRNGEPDPRQVAVQRRIERYAAKFNADTVRQGAEWVQCDPTDENLAYTLDRCVRPARPGEYPAIREAVLRQRGEDAVV
jgi:hypothetical protein